jgi:hypothetical protein
MKPAAVLAFGALVLVAACSREPRSAAYFSAHPDEADRVLARCQMGGLGGQECVNAQSGPVTRENAARLERYRKALGR